MWFCTMSRSAPPARNSRRGLDAERFGDGDLHVVDVLVVPDRLEDRVGEPQRQQVLHRLLAQVVVDAEDLVLGEVLVKPLVQLLRGGEVVAERLLDHEARPARRATALADLVHERRDRARRHCEVVDAVARCSALLVDMGEAFGEAMLERFVPEVGRDVVHPSCELIPDVLPEGIARVLLHRFFHPRAEAVVALLGPRGADDRELLREQVAVGERVERGNELALRQVAGRAEDHERARIGRPPELEALEQRIFFGDGHSLLTACPPNSLRSAAVIFAANDSSCRDAKRA